MNIKLTIIAYSGLAGGAAMPVADLWTTAQVGLQDHFKWQLQLQLNDGSSMLHMSYKPPIWWRRPNTTAMIGSMSLRVAQSPAVMQHPQHSRLRTCGHSQDTVLTAWHWCVSVQVCFVKLDNLPAANVTYNSCGAPCKFELSMYTSAPQS